MVDDHIRSHDFTGDAATGSKVNAGALNSMLDMLFNKDNEQNDFAEIIQRDDGQLRDDIVRLRSLHPEIIDAVINQAGIDDDTLIGIIDTWLKGLTVRLLDEFEDSDEMLIRGENGDWQRADLGCLAEYICAKCNGGGSGPTPPPLGGITLVGQLHMWSSRVLRPDYAGPLMRVRRESDDGEQDFFADPSTGRVEVADLEAFKTVPSEQLFAVRYYDQYPLAFPTRDCEQTNISRQPRITDPLGNIYVSPGGYVGWQRLPGENGFLQTGVINNPSAGAGFGFTYTSIRAFGGDRSILEHSPGGWRLVIRNNAPDWHMELRWDALNIQSLPLTNPPPVPAPFEAWGWGGDDFTSRGYRNGTNEGVLTPGSHDVGASTLKWGDDIGGGGSADYIQIEAVAGANRPEIDFLPQAGWLTFQQEQLASLGVT